jgi:uncharacterized protein (UPF0276 family)
MTTLKNNLGFGLGLRPVHYDAILDDRAGAATCVDWFEALTENYLVPGGKPIHYLDRVRERFPIVLHGVSLSIGSVGPLDRDYLSALKALAQRVEPAWISDHLCWTGFGGVNTHDLLPLPLSEESLVHVTDRVRAVQDFLGRRILLENPSTYVDFACSAIPEAEFLAELARRADCLILLDVNNVYVSAFNHGFDAGAYLAALPPERVRQIHLAGHADRGTHIVDTHDRAVIDPVWSLYAEALRRFGLVATMIERDADIPPLVELVAELDRARTLAGDAVAEAAA